MTLPNLITLFRILLAPFFFTCLVSYEVGKEYYRWIAFTIFVVGSFSDALDGFIARVTHKQTDLGRFLDPLADKLLLLSGFVGLLFVSDFPFQPPLWVTVSIVFRDMVILGGVVVIFFVSGQIHAKPNLLGKVTTFFQMAALFTILLGLKISIPICYVTAGLTILSGIVYVVRDLRMLQIPK